MGLLLVVVVLASSIIDLDFNGTVPLSSITAPHQDMSVDPFWKKQEAGGIF